MHEFSRRIQKGRWLEGHVIGHPGAQELQEACKLTYNNVAPPFQLFGLSFQT